MRDDEPVVEGIVDGKVSVEGDDAEVPNGGGAGEDVESVPDVAEGETERPLGVVELEGDGDGHDERAHDQVRHRHRHDEVVRGRLQVAPAHHRHHHQRVPQHRPQAQQHHQRAQHHRLHLHHRRLPAAQPAQPARTGQEADAGPSASGVAFMEGPSDLRIEARVGCPGKKEEVSRSSLSLASANRVQIRPPCFLPHGRRRREGYKHVATMSHCSDSKATPEGEGSLMK